MDDSRLFRIVLQIAGNTVVEAHADSYQQVTLVCHHVRCEIPVHAKLAHIERMVGWGGRQAEDCCAEWYLGFLAEGEELITGIGELDTLTDKHKRLHAVVNHTGGILYRALCWCWHRVVAAYEINVFRLVVYHGRLGVLREVEDDRPWTSAARDIEGTGYSPCDILRTAYLVVPLGDRLGYAYYINLLKSVCAQHRGTDLTTYHDYRGRVDHSVGNTGYCVRGARPRCHDCTAYFA